MVQGRWSDIERRWAWLTRELGENLWKSALTVAGVLAAYLLAFILSVISLAFVMGN